MPVLCAVPFAALEPPSGGCREMGLSMHHHQVLPQLWQGVCNNVLPLWGKNVCLCRPSAQVCVVMLLLSHATMIFRTVSTGPSCRVKRLRQFLSMHARCLTNCIIVMWWGNKVSLLECQPGFAAGRSQLVHSFCKLLERVDCLIGGCV